MNRTWVALLLGAALGSVVSMGCGQGTAACGPGNCATGCCDANNKCQPGQGALQCGTNGNSCVACSGFQICSLGTCMMLSSGSGGGSAGGSGGTAGGSAGGTAGGSAGGAAGGSAGGTAGGSAGGAAGGSAGGTAGGSAGGTAGGSAGGTAGGSAGGTAGGSAGGTAGGSAGGSAGGAGGAAGGVAGGFAGGAGRAGDTCASPVPLTAGVTISGQTLFDFSDDYSSAGQNQLCQLAGVGGADRTYSIVVPSNQRLIVTAQANGGLDTSVNLFLNAAACSARSCVGSGQRAPPNADSSSYINQTGTFQTVLIVVDSFTTNLTASHTFSLSATIGASGDFTYTKDVISGACTTMTGSTELLSATTTPVLSDDTTTAKLVLPANFAFAFYGTPVTQFSAQSNGMMQLFGSSDLSAPTHDYNNVAIPTAAQPNSFLAPYWFDFVDVSTGRVHWLTTGTTPNRVMTVEWNFPDEGARFQAKLFETLNLIEFHYCAMGTNTGSGATVGVENPSGTVGYQHSLNSSAEFGAVPGLRFNAR